MFLRRVTITGFKSFANRTILDLSPGLTAVVGPNGSGKSNFAEAIKWAFGEQSRTKLRLDDRHDVIFAGTANRPRASYAEVTLLFDNEDGAFPLDLTEVEITRRLYRSGESNYLLAGRDVRQADIQSLLAQAGLGVGTYAVVGQGMIDSLLLSSPAERKLLFDEAAGIRGPELKREEAMRKLDLTTANLQRLRDIAGEIQPRLESLKQSQAASNTKRALTEQIKVLTGALAHAEQLRLSKQQSQLTQQLQAAKKAVTDAKSALERVSREVAAAEEAQAGQAAHRRHLQDMISKLEKDRDALATELAESRSAVTTARQAGDRAAELHKALTKAKVAYDNAAAKCNEAVKDLDDNEQAAKRALAAVERAGQAVQTAQAQLVSIRKSNEETAKDQYVEHALQILRSLAVSLGESDPSLHEVRLLVHKAGRLLSHASKTSSGELLESLQVAQKQLESAMLRRETAVEHQTNITITGRSLEIDVAHLEAEVARLNREVLRLTQQLSDTKALASTLDELNQKCRRTETQLTEKSTVLDNARHELQTLEPTQQSLAETTSLAVQLERLSREVSVRSQECADLERGLREINNELAAASPRQSNETNDVQAERSVEDLNEELVRLQAQLDTLSQLELDQSGEYERVSARYAELTSQITDLEQASSDLRHVISDLEKLVKDRFAQNFETLSGHFSEYFRRLFGGGNAALMLSTNEDGSYGISINASPSGKRLSQVGALSGGERALAGTALLAAILRTSTSPFVVLDEVDAALDEANSARLADILAELGTASQLIVITHNRQTMRAADVIYGITSNEQHVSHVLSMRLEEADRLAAR